MNNLFIVNKANNLAACLKQVQAGDGLLLIEDAVLIALEKLEKTIQVSQWVLTEDLIARDLQGKTSADWETLDYQGFVEKSLAFDKAISWL